MFNDGFPDYLKDDETKAVALIPDQTYHNVAIGVSQDYIQYYQDNKMIRFPYRMYFIDDSDQIIDNLSARQKMILHCIYSRSCDGVVRQKHIYSLLQMDYEDWAIPYIVKICDEYVVEIIEMTYEILKEEDTERIKTFCLENVESLCKSYNRMISYWNEYHRSKYKDFHHYIGRKLYRDCFGYTRKLERRKNSTLK